MSSNKGSGAGVCRPQVNRLIALLSLVMLVSCATHDVPPLQALDRKVDLDRFMGDWYVIGFIPITIPFFSEAGAHNGVESYRLTEKGVIETTYTFRDGDFDGPERRFTPKGWVHDEETNAEWRMQIVWPFKAAYLIVYLDDDYQKTIIGVPDRKHVWIMSRDPELSETTTRRCWIASQGSGTTSRRCSACPNGGRMDEKP